MAAWEYEALAVNFFCQKISPEEFRWLFPHSRLTAKEIDHLADCGARGVMLLVLVPPMPGFFRVFSAGKVASFIRNFYRIFLSWESPEGIERSFLRGPARQKVFIIEFDFRVANPLALV